MYRNKARILKALSSTADAQWEFQKWRFFHLVCDLVETISIGPVTELNLRLC